MQTALELLILDGYFAINIKTVSNEIGCSTQPLVWHFEKMEGLRKALADYALQYANAKIKKGGSKMSISIQNYSASSNKAAYSKAPKSTSSAEATANSGVQSIANTDQAAEEDALSTFKKDFYQDLEKIKMHSTVINAAVNISDKAFEKMQADPQYRQKVLSLLQRDLCSSYAARKTAFIKKQTMMMRMITRKSGWKHMRK